MDRIGAATTLAAPKPSTTRTISAEVLRLRTQMRAAHYNPDLPHQVEALACITTITTQRLADVLTGRAPLDWRIPRDRLTRTLSIATTGPDHRATRTAVTL